MENAGRSTVAPAPGTDNPDLAAGRVPTRAEIEARQREVLVEGASAKADVYVVGLPSGPVVVKDFARKPWWGRALGRILVWREARAYHVLAGVRGVARWVGRIDPHALAVEKVDGEQLFTSERRFEYGQQSFDRLREVLDDVHGRGIVHLDMRGRENVLVRPDGEVVLIDFQSAVRLRPGGLAHYVLFAWLKAADDSGFLKWKEQILPASLTPEERRFLDRHERVRKWWPFNRKRARAPREGA